MDHPWIPVATSLLLFARYLTLGMATSSKWTAEEDSILVDAVVAAGSRICWNTIAERLPGRSNKSCRKRWIHSLDPSLRKGRWTTPEDALLITAVRRHGRHWYKVAELLPGRTDDQCAKRWREKLDPTIRRDAWTGVEDLKLLEALEKHGKRWNVISGCIKGRPAVQCRNRFLSLQRAGRVSEDGKVSPSGTMNRSPTSGAKNYDNGLSDCATMVIDARLEPSTSPTLSTSSPSSPPPCPSSPSSVSSVEPALPTWDSTSASPPLVSMDCLGSTQISTDPHAFQMSLDLMGPEFFNSRSPGISPSLNSPSSSPFTPSPGTFELSLPPYAGTPFTFTGLASAEHPFDWGENFITPPSYIAPAQKIQDPSIFSVRGLVQSPSVTSPSEDSSSFVMTCPLPMCSHQSNELISIWRHITWDHLGDANKYSKATTELVEKVVLGAGEQQ